MDTFTPPPIDPLSQAKCVADPAIKEVIDLDTGQVLGSAEFIERYRNAELIETPFDGRKPAGAAETTALPFGFHRAAELGD